MSVLITGAGFVGCHVARHLLDRGETAVLYDVAPSFEQIRSIIGQEEVPLVRANILDLPELLAAVQRHRVECIVHTAGLLGRGMAGTAYNGIKVNLEGTLNVLECARLSGVRAVAFCSTQQVYHYAALPDRLVDEEHPVRPPTLYASTKLAAEGMGTWYSETYGFRFVALRMASIFGPAAPGSGKGLNLFVEAPALGRPIEIQRPRTFVGKTEYLYVKDAARALVAACVSPGLPSRVFNIGMGALYGLHDIAETARRLLPEVEISVGDPGPEEPQFVRPQPFDLSLARRELGWEPEFNTLEKGFRDQIATIRARAGAP